MGYKLKIREKKFILSLNILIGGTYIWIWVFMFKVD